MSRSFPVAAIRVVKVAKERVCAAEWALREVTRRPDNGSGARHQTTPNCRPARSSGWPSGEPRGRQAAAASARAPGARGRGRERWQRYGHWTARMPSSCGRSSTTLLPGSSARLPRPCCPRPRNCPLTGFWCAPTPSGRGTSASPHSGCSTRGGTVALRAAVGLFEDPDTKLRTWAAQSVQRWHPSPDGRRGDAEGGEPLDRSRQLFSDHALRRRKWEAGVESWHCTARSACSLNAIVLWRTRDRSAALRTWPRAARLRLREPLVGRPRYPGRAGCSQGSNCPRRRPGPGGVGRLASGRRMYAAGSPRRIRASSAGTRRASPCSSR